METEAGNAEVSNDLEELVTEPAETEENKYTSEETTRPSEVETLEQDSEEPKPFVDEPKPFVDSLDQEVSEQDVADETETPDNSQRDIEDNLNLESDNPVDDVASGTVDNSNSNSDIGKESEENSNDVQETFSANQELSNENESEEVIKNTDDVLDLEEPLTQSEETECITDEILKDNDDETKDNYETEGLDEDKNIEAVSVQIGDDTHQQSEQTLTHNVEDISQDSLNPEADQSRQTEDTSGDTKEEDITSSIETAKKDDDQGGDDDIDEVVLEGNGDDNTDKIGK